MTQHGNGCIFRCTSTGQTEDTVPTNPFTGQLDKIEFDGTAVIPDNTGHLRETSVHAVIGLSENPKPKINNPNDLQDMGLSSLEYTLVGVVENAYATLVSKTFLSWLQDFRKNTAFSKGRFGIRYNNDPAYNLTPDNTAGYILADYFERQPSQYRTKLEFIAKFRFTGDPTKLLGS